MSEGGCGMVWYIIFAIGIILEFFTVSFLFLSFCIGALFASGADHLGFSLTAQIITFIVISIISFIVLKPIAKKYLHKDVEKTNVDALIDSFGIVTKKIDNVKQVGAVKVKGLEYTARAVNDNEIIEKGEEIVVRKIEGVKLIVERKPKETSLD